jgi:hypothetical protein
MSQTFCIGVAPELFFVVPEKSQVKVMRRFPKLQVTVYTLLLGYVSVAGNFNLK